MGEKEGGRQDWSQRVCEGGRRGERKGEGLKQQCAEPMAFPPRSSWPASGEDAVLLRTGGRTDGRVDARTLRAGRLAAGRNQRHFHEAFMGCTIYAASPKALPADEAPGQDSYYPLAHYRHLHGNCSQRIAARWVGWGRFGEGGRGRKGGQDGGGDGEKKTLIEICIIAAAKTLLCQQMENYIN